MIPDFSQQGFVGKCADYLMMPLMYVLQGNFRESPQRTHRWNNIHLAAQELHFLEDEQMVSVKEDETASARWRAFLPIFHIPLFGGWKQFVVLEPTSPQDIWFVGWVAGDVAGVSTIPLTGPVRVLRGASPVQFFGINEHGNQIDMVKSGEGEVGKVSTTHQRVPLL